MGVGPSLMRQRGTVPLTEPAVASVYKGMVTTRSLPSNPNTLPIGERAAIRASLGTLSPRWRTLSQAQRESWEEYAITLGGVHEQTGRTVAGGAKNIIPPHKVLMSGINAYLRSNMLANTSGIPTPQDIPPLGVETPPPPTDVQVTIAQVLGDVVATVTWVDPLLSGVHDYVKIRVWAQFIAPMSYHRQLVGSVDVGVGVFSFSSMQGPGGVAMPLATLLGGILRVQLQTVIAHTVGIGANVSAPSAIWEGSVPMLYAMWDVTDWDASNWS